MLIKSKLFVPLGVDSTPLGQRKCLEVLGSLVGGIANIFSQDSANKANREMTDQTNKVNYQIAKETNAMSQAQFDANMKWLREQYYDVDQVARAVQAANRAGLNPALALGQVSPIGSVGQASPTQFHAAQMDAGHVEPVQFGDGLSESIGHAVDAYYNNQLRSSQAENVNADTQIKRAQALTEFASRLADIRSKYADIELKLSQKGVNEETRKKLIVERDKIDGEIKQFWTLWDDTLKSAKYGNRLLQLQGDSAQQDVVGKVIENNFKPAMLRAGIRLSNAQSTSLIEHLKLIEPQISDLFASGNLKTKQATGQFIINYLNSLDLQTKKELKGLYESNKVSNRIKQLFYMLGDALFSQFKVGINGKF